MSRFWNDPACGKVNPSQEEIDKMFDQCLDSDTEKDRRIEADMKEMLDSLEFVPSLPGSPPPMVYEYIDGELVEMTVEEFARKHGYEV